METVYIGNTLVNDIMLGRQRMDDVFTRFIGNDPNVRNFVSATGITNTNTINALDTLVITLKSNNIWDKLYAVYPFVGGTQNTNRVNLINTASFNLGFTGSWVYNDNGISGNGTNTFANTSFIPISSVSDFNTNSSLAIYTRTDTTSSGYDMGCEDDLVIQRRVYLISKTNANKSQYDVSTNALTSTADQNGAGLFIGNISGSSANNQKIFRNGTSIANQTNIISESAVTVPLYIGANNFRNTSVNAYVSESFSYASIGKGFTDSQASTYYTVVQNFQTTLGRQV